MLDVHQQLHTLVSATPLGEVLDGVGSTHCEVFYKCYLNDFVRSVHKCSHKYAEKEYEVRCMLVNTKYFLKINAILYLSQTAHC